MDFIVEYLVPTKMLVQITGPVAGVSDAVKIAASQLPVGSVITSAYRREAKPPEEKA